MLDQTLANDFDRALELDNAPIDWAALESHVTPDGTFAPPTRTAKGIDAKVVKFPCIPCRGSGRFQGVRRHQPETRCFACGGKGYFLTSERDRQNARQKAAARKTTKLADARTAFDQENPGISAFLADAARWSTFAADILAKLNQYGSLTENQLRPIRSMQAKCAATREAKAAERQQGAATIDLSPIRAMFETAAASGYKKPIYRAADLVISRAPMHGKNPGALYVKTVGDEYLGKIIGTNYTGRPAPALTAIAADPRGEAIKYGQRTGTCSCCGAKLTNGESIDRGIGPICAAKWGLA